MSRWHLAILLVLALPILGAGACNEEEKAAQKLFEKGKRLEKARQYTQAMDIYKELQKKYPETSVAKHVKDAVDFGLLEQALAIDRLKNVNEVKDHLKQIAKAVEGYNFKESKFPTSLDDLVPAYTPALPRDPWGGRYTYGAMDDAGNILEPGTAGTTGYIVASFGRDRVPGGDGDDSDVFIRNGQFLQF